VCVCACGIEEEEGRFGGRMEVPARDDKGGSCAAKENSSGYLECEEPGEGGMDKRYGSRSRRSRGLVINK